MECATALARREFRDGGRRRRASTFIDGRSANEVGHLMQVILIRMRVAPIALPTARPL
jgi:hypothetical protein